MSTSGPFDDVKPGWVLLSRYESVRGGGTRVVTRMLCPECGRKAWEVAT